MKRILLITLAAAVILAVLPVIVCTVISVICLVYTYKKWINKVRG